MLRSYFFGVLEFWCYLLNQIKKTHRKLLWFLPQFHMYCAPCVFFISSFSRDSCKRADQRNQYSRGFKLLGIVKDCVPKSWDDGLLHGLELYVSIWNLDLPLLDLLLELENKLAADWFIGWEVSKRDSCDLSPSETDMGISLLEEADPEVFIF